MWTIQWHQRGAFVDCRYTVKDTVLFLHDATLLRWRNGNHRYNNNYFRYILRSISLQLLHSSNMLMIQSGYCTSVEPNAAEHVEVTCPLVYRWLHTFLNSMERSVSVSSLTPTILGGTKSMLVWLLLYQPFLGWPEKFAGLIISIPTIVGGIKEGWQCV